MDNRIFVPAQPPLTEAERSRLLGSAGEENVAELSDMLAQAEAAAAPKAIYAVVPRELVNGGVKIRSIAIASELMRENFTPSSRVFPYVCTCGVELEEWSLRYADDPLAEYWADEIKKLYLTRVITAFYAMIKEEFDIRGHFAQMNPGSIADWPLSGQRELFEIIGADEILSGIGVRLTESSLMLPSKSVDGIGFESERGYQNCTRCPILTCPNRRAPYGGGN